MRSFQPEGGRSKADLGKCESVSGPFRARAPPRFMLVYDGFAGTRRLDAIAGSGTSMARFDPQGTLAELIGDLFEHFQENARHRGGGVETGFPSENATMQDS
jgi:hypothetical protein